MYKTAVFSESDPTKLEARINELLKGIDMGDLIDIKYSTSPITKHVPITHKQGVAKDFLVHNALVIYETELPNFNHTGYEEIQA